MQIDITPMGNKDSKYRFIVEPFPDNSGSLLIQDYGNNYTRRSLILSTADEQALLHYLQSKYESSEGGSDGPVR